VKQAVVFAPLPKKVATKIWHQARKFDRQTRRKGRHGGRLGHMAMLVLETLIFDFLNFKSGRLDPSYEAIARKANVCRRTVASALQRLRECGVLTWLRRCSEGMKDGRYVLAQETNAYAVCPPSQWLGFRPEPEPPAPLPEAWGAHPSLPDVLTQAAQAVASGAGAREVIALLESDPGDALSKALARLRRAMDGGSC
jgi:hypothetical protein